MNKLSARAAGSADGVASMQSENQRLRSEISDLKAAAVKAKEDAQEALRKQAKELRDEAEEKLQAAAKKFEADKEALIEEMALEVEVWVKPHRS